MTIDTTPAVDEAIQRHMASGRFGSEIELIERALRALDEQDALEAIREGVEDARAGRSRSVDEVFDDFERKYPNLKS